MKTQGSTETTVGRQSKWKSGWAKAGTKMAQHWRLRELSGILGVLRCHEVEARMRDKEGRDMGFRPVKTGTTL